MIPRTRVVNRVVGAGPPSRRTGPREKSRCGPVAEIPFRIDNLDARGDVRLMATGPSDPLSTLQHVLASAAQIAHDLAGDALMPRVLDVFARMPEEDRETILMVLEREVDLRNMSLAAPSGPLAGPSLTKPNPNARIYLRVTDNDPGPYVTPEEIVQAVMRAARVMYRALERRPDVSRIWEPSMIRGLEAIGPAEREAIRWFHRRILELLDASEERKPG